MQFTDRKLFLMDRHKLEGPLSHKTPLSTLQTRQGNIVSAGNDMQFTDRKLFLTDCQELYEPYELMTCNLRTVKSSLRTVNSLTDRMNCTDRKATRPLLELENMQFTDCKLFLTDRKFNSRTVTVRVY